MGMKDWSFIYLCHIQTVFAVGLDLYFPQVTMARQCRNDPWLWAERYDRTPCMPVVQLLCNCNRRFW